jgi:predicted nucleotidyltransferase
LPAFPTYHIVFEVKDEREDAFVAGRRWNIPKLGTIIPKMGNSKKSAQGRRPLGKRADGAHRASAPGGGLAGALFTSTQQRLFTLLFGQSDRSFFLGELIELADSGRGAVQRELARLADVGLVITKAVGNQRHFQANQAAPIFNELQALVLKTVGLAEPIKAALAHVPEPIELALIFGSFAKHSATASSDVDLLIVSGRLSLERAYAVLAPAEQAISRKLSVTLLTPKEFQQRRIDNSPFLNKVLSGQHILLAGDLDGVTATR